MIRIRRTPVECYRVLDREIWVKREDRVVEGSAPPFSKIRGLVDHLKALKDEGVRRVGYVETSVSMAGWGVAWASSELGLKCVLFDPVYKNTPDILRLHRIEWDRWGAIREPIKAGMARVNYNICRNRLREIDPAAVMLDLGLPLEETVRATAVEWSRAREEIRPNTTVVCVGSGTVCAGILRAWKGDGTIIGVMSREGDVARKRLSIARKARVSLEGLFGAHFRLEDPGWGYTEESHCPCPFPSHSYYDLKAWQWLVEHLRELEEPILFWNIGRSVYQKELPCG